MTTGSPLPPPQTRREAWLVASFLLTLAILLGASGAVWAHAVVTGTEPPDGALLPGPPSEIVVRFNEPVALTRAQVLGPEGEDMLPADGAQSEANELHLPLPERLAQGTYTVSYHVVSIDGHPIAGSLVFSVGRVSRGAAGTPGATAVAFWRWTFVAARVVLYLGLLGAAGGVAFTVLIRPGEAARAAVQRIVGMSVALGLLAAVLALGLQGGLLLGGPIRTMGDPETWHLGATSTFGRTAFCDIAGLILIGVSHRTLSFTGSRLLSGLGAALLVIGFALSGHVITAGPRWLTSPPLLLHAAVAAFWVGSLLPLHRALAGSADEAGRLLQGFSRLAVWVVAGLVAAGLVLAWLQVRRPEALLTTDYGRLLLAKLAMVAALLSLAALNRLRLTPALVRGDPDAPRRLGRSIMGEIALVVGVLAATATLGTTPPPRALTVGAAIDTPDRHAHEEHGHLMPERVLRLAGERFEAVVILVPGVVGANMAMIVLRDPSGEPLEVPEVTLRLSNTSRGIAPLERPAQAEEPGHWRVDDVLLGVPGQWDVELDVLISDFERQTLGAPLDLR